MKSVTAHYLATSLQLLAAGELTALVVATVLREPVRLLVAVLAVIFALALISIGCGIIERHSNEG